MSPQPGEVWLADLGLAAKTRPVVIVSRFDPDPPRALAIYVPLTTQNRQSGYELRCRGLPSSDRNRSLTCKELPRSRTVRLERRLGRLPEHAMAAIKRALVYALDLDI